MKRVATAVRAGRAPGPDGGPRGCTLRPPTPKLPSPPLPTISPPPTPPRCRRGSGFLGFLGLRIFGFQTPTTHPPDAAGGDPVQALGAFLVKSAAKPGSSWRVGVMPQYDYGDGPAPASGNGAAVNGPQVCATRAMRDAHEAAAPASLLSPSPPPTLFLVAGARACSPLSPSPSLPCPCAHAWGPAVPASLPPTSPPPSLAPRSRPHACLRLHTHGHAWARMGTHGHTCSHACACAAACVRGRCWPTSARSPGTAPLRAAPRVTCCSARCPPSRLPRPHSCRRVHAGGGGCEGAGCWVAGRARAPLEPSTRGCNLSERWQGAPFTPLPRGVIHWASLPHPPHSSHPILPTRPPTPACRWSRWASCPRVGSRSTWTCPSRACCCGGRTS
jgi:hypothetical protein